ncbi:Structural maintenance of chromosomes protein 5 [Paramarasmius palmivorus]|uniref:Structural maintenance of chromosomes protein 5 n=1 Tax=Paramarasmius palmivorus TaxID=297713 RepID=A0AAW0BT31_9AGAR
MTRRTHRSSASDNDSLKENHIVNSTGSNAVKIKTEKARQQVSANVKGKQRAVEEEEEEEQRDGHEEEADGERDEEEDNQGEGSPKGRKRQKVNAEGEARPSQSHKEEVVVKTQPRDTDGFIPGQIVRIQLQNFLTYDFANFNCGPYLNMIIGPNGTGKSSIACAIALGLNWPPSILGRAESIQSFVKNDKETGYVEIEMKAPRGRPNLVIRRNIHSGSKTNSFTLNGKPATGKEVAARMAELNVQISNLCTFLPQDKVSSFAMMSPQQLLKETQRAAGDRNLTAWHETLIRSGNEHRTMLQTIKEEEEQLHQMQERNAAIEKEVERYNERKRIEERSLKKELQQAERAREKKKESIKRRFDQMNSKWSQNSKLEADIESLNSQMEELEIAEQRRKQKIKKLEEEIAAIEVELKRVVQTENLEHLMEETRQNIRDRQEVSERLREFGARIDEAVRDRTSAERQVEELENKLRQLDTVDGRKMSNLARWDRDVADVVLWLRQNQHRFQKGILEPAFLSLTVRDQRYADAVESCIGSGQMKTFVAQCREDYDLFNDLVNDKNSVIGRPCRVPTWFRDREVLDRITIPPPMSGEEMSQLHFDGYAIDFVECPEGLKTYLMAELQMHRTAIALSQNIDVETAMNLVSRPIGSFPGGANFITGPYPYSVDTERKRQLEAEIREHKQKVAVCAEEVDKLMAEAKPHEDELKDLQNKKTDLERRKEAVQKEKQRINTFQSRKERFVTQLKAEKKVPPPEKERQNIRKKMAKIAKDRMVLADEHVKLVRAVIDEQVESTRLGLEYLQIAANKIAFEELCEKKAEKFTKALEEWGKVDAEYRHVKDQSKEALYHVHSVMDEAPPELAEVGRRIQAARKEYAKALKEAEENGTEHPSKENVDLRSCQELEIALEDQKAQLELVTKTNPGVVEQYEKRKREIEQLEAIVDRKKKEAESVEKSINTAKVEPRPQLYISVSLTVHTSRNGNQPCKNLLTVSAEKFSAAFDRIGCAGEIRIAENEDYDKWAIDILVKFRDDEKLQLLTGQRQSGGERSLTTILYLMSLTEEARTPFSLVDEINQGMDQRAERVVHDNMVDVTCKDTAGQYFLITPKLLPDLKYHERMKVLCVANGEWLPEETGLGNLNRLIDGFLSVKRGNGTSSH